MCLQKQKRIAPMKTYNRIIELFWLAVFIVSLVWAGFVFINHGFQEEHYFNLVVPAMSLVLFLLRRAYRKRLEQHEE